MKPKETSLFLALLRELQKINTEFPLQYAICLVEIASDEGLSLTTLSQRTGMPLSTTSRIVGALSIKRQKGEPYGLVDVKIVAAEKRKKALFLTLKGKILIQNINDLLLQNT